jgi:hypothetical protein
MRKGFADARVAASGLTAAHNVRLFIELREFEGSRVDTKAWHAAICMATHLEQILRRHAAERRAGLRQY